MTRFECNSPLSLRRAESLIAALNLSAQDRVLDAGCGTGAFLIEAIDVSGAVGQGLDLDQAALAAARERALRRGVDERCQFQAADLRTDALEANAFDAAICLGASHSFADAERAYPATLEALTKSLRPGGRLLIGEGFWQQPPSEAYRAHLGDPIGIYLNHQGNVDAGVARGLIALHASTSDTQEWDDFEWGHIARAEQQAIAHPNDPDTAARLQSTRRWRDGYLRWGRDTLGFGFYLFQKPSA